jgi:hypothetical protein
MLNVPIYPRCFLAGAHSARPDAFYRDQLVERYLRNPVLFAGSAWLAGNSIFVLPQIHLYNEDNTNETNVDYPTYLHNVIQRDTLYFEKNLMET